MDHRATTTGAVLTCADIGIDALERLLAPFALRIARVADGAPIPGSHWGAPEAGLAGGALHLRADTPAHSALHEACHWICMDGNRRAGLDTDAGGDDAEEVAVCCLSVVLADALPGLGRARMLADMDAWGYSFRLGSARAWFERDADDARTWLRAHGLVDAAGHPTGRRRP